MNKFPVFPREISDVKSKLVHRLWLVGLVI